MKTVQFPAGKVIFQQGDTSSEAYLILSGEVEISIQTPTGRSTLAQLGEGEIFGEMGIITDRPRSATARAITETEAEVVDEGDFYEEVLSDPTRLLPYIESLFERLRTTDTLLQMELDKHKRPENPFADPAEAIELPEACERWEGPPPVIHITAPGDTELEIDPVDREITEYPFRIGRDLPSMAPEGAVGSNDLNVRDAVPLQVSRHHCSIEMRGKHVIIRDRGSSVGTIVNGVKLGVGGVSLMAELQKGENTVILGRRDSPHHFILDLLLPDDE